MVLSDIVTAASEQAGELRLAFVWRVTNDRDPLGAMRPEGSLSGRKLFVAAELFTVGCGELSWALLPAG